ncbi:hypothetical protein [Mucilaginibacter panaciglaebae]|uniref:Uncharacterized protein n=1 Tax=Mucilaginibacter panaciglaebae TaxID=502331 RepID=A0ABP7WUB9_9SPHI
MKQLEVFNKIGGILKELNEQYQYIKADPENINDLEMELFVANAHFLTDHAEILNKLNQRTKAEKAEETRADKVGTKADSKLLPAPDLIGTPERQFDLPVRNIEPPMPVESPKPELINFTEPERSAEPAQTSEEEKLVESAKPAVNSEKFFEPLVQQPKLKRSEAVESEQAPAQIDLSSDVPKDSYSFMMEPPEVIRHELEIDPDDIFDDNDEETAALPVEEEVTPEPVKVKISKPDLKGEPKPEIKVEPEAVEKKEEIAKAKDEVLTINERMSTQRSGASHYTEPAAQPVTNLKAAITLNDKLIFIKDLFNGYSLAYSEAIEILNRFNTFEEANRFLTKNYTVKNKWDSKPETAEKFYSLLKRRYA